MAKKYFWLKLSADFFKSIEMKLLMSMENGMAFIVFYLMTMLETINKEGILTKSDICTSISQELSILLGMEECLIKDALDALEKLRLIEINDTQLVFIRLSDMVGSEGASTERVRKHRANQKSGNNNVTQCNDDVTNTPNICNTEIERESDIEQEEITESDAEVEQDIEQVVSYMPDPVVNAKFCEFLDYRETMNIPTNDIAIKACVARLSKLSDDPDIQLEIIDQAIRHGWKDLYEVNSNQNKNDNDSDDNIKQWLSNEGSGES